MENTQDKKVKQSGADKKPYMKPMAEKHKAAAIVAGSSGSCSVYQSRTSGLTYYY